MRTYDPADRILYVHLAQEPAAAPLPPRADDGCHRLPAGYANASPGTKLAAPADARPALVLLTGGSSGSAPSTPALRLAR
jgi:hypothetical protein